MPSVRYRVTVSDNWNYINADDYKFVRASDCYVGFRPYLTFTRAVSQHPNNGGYKDHFNFDIYFANVIYSSLIDYQLRIGSTFTLSNPNSLVCMIPQVNLFTAAFPNGMGWQGFTHGSNGGQSIYFPLSEWSASANSFRIINIGDPIKSPCNNCRLVAYKNGVTVFNQAFLECPIVEIGDFDVCPPNTCDVLCGNTICCYDSEGISVFSFPST
jgi:hypothetical protein